MNGEELEIVDVLGCFGVKFSKDSNRRTSLEEILAWEKIQRCSESYGNWKKLECAECKKLVGKTSYFNSDVWA